MGGDVLSVSLVSIVTRFYRSMSTFRSRMTVVVFDCHAERSEASLESSVEDG